MARPRWPIFSPSCTAARPWSTLWLVSPGTTVEGTSLERLVLVAHQLGVPLRLLVADPAGAPLPTPPYLAWVEQRHFVLVAARAVSDTLVVVDPAVGRYRISAHAFRARWSGAAAVTGAVSLTEGT